MRSCKSMLGFDGILPLSMGHSSKRTKIDESSSDVEQRSISDEFSPMLSPSSGFSLTTSSSCDFSSCSSGETLNTASEDLTKVFGQQAFLSDASAAEQLAHLQQRCHEQQRRIQQLEFANQQGDHELRGVLQQVSGLIKTMDSALERSDNMHLDTPVQSHKLLAISQSLHDTCTDIELLCERGLRICDNRLLFAKLDAHQVQLKRTVFELPKLLQNLCQTMQKSKQSEGKNVVFDYHIHSKEVAFDDNALTLETDVDLLSQVFVNFLRNAYDHTCDVDKPLKKITIDCEIEAITTGQYAMFFNVVDNGEGMLERDRIRIGQAFVQGNSTKNQGINRSGLGLSINAKLLSLLFPECSKQPLIINSEYGQGSRFGFKALLTRRTKLSPKVAVSTLSAKSYDLGKGISNLNGLKVLVADDVQVNAKIMKNRIERLPDKSIPVQTESSIAGAWQYYKEHFKKIAMILLDVNFATPNDGLDLLKQIRQHEKDHRLPHMPIYLLTAQDKSSLDELKQLEVDGVYNKHVPDDELYKICKDAIEQKQLRMFGSSYSDDVFAKCYHPHYSSCNQQVACIPTTIRGKVLLPNKQKLT